MESARMILTASINNSRLYFYRYMMITRKIKLLILGVLIAPFMSCDSNRIFDDSVAVKEKGWDINDIKVLTVTISDINSLNNLYINLRNTTDYRYSNILFFLETEYPNQKVSKDTIECILAAPDGKWLGKGMGKIKDNRILFKKGVRFPLKGVYKFRFQQAMRQKNLTGIKDIGLRIEKQ